MTSRQYDYLDGNAAGGQLSQLFAVDVTAAVGQCGHCGTNKRFAEAHVYMRGPGMVARCSVCGHVLLRVANAGQRILLDVSGVTCLSVDVGQ